MGDIYDHTENRGFSSGWGSRERQDAKHCPYCKGTDLIFPDKYYARCKTCGRIISRSVLRHQR